MFRLPKPGQESRGCNHATRSPRDEGPPDRGRAESQRRKILRVLSRGKPMTAEEIGRAIGVVNDEGAALGCSHKRVSELVAHGLVSPTGEYRRSLVGGQQRVVEITAAGRKAMSLPPSISVIPRK